MTKITQLSFAILLSVMSWCVWSSDIATDEQIAKIVITTNKGEVELAKMAELKADSREVKKFAENMIKTHSKSHKKSIKLSKKMSLIPQESLTNAEIEKETQRVKEILSHLRGAEFDKTYMDKQVRMHQKFLAELDTTLIPQAKNRRLKRMLEKTRIKVAQHLEEAQKFTSTVK